MNPLNLPFSYPILFWLVAIILSVYYGIRGIFIQKHNIANENILKINNSPKLNAWTLTEQIMVHDGQERTEITIFDAFAKACSLQIKLESVKKMAPPKPDIQCEAVGTKVMTFELVEIIDRNFANLSGKQDDTKEKLSEYYSNLAQHQKNQFDELYSNAMIFPEFENKSTLRQRQNIFPKIFNHLLSLGPEFEGETCKNYRDFKGNLKEISISRGKFKGPIFNLPFAGTINDPTISTLKKKFSKSYESDHQLHLLAYINLTPMFAD
jgi:hypothetical protein